MVNLQRSRVAEATVPACSTVSSDNLRLEFLSIVGVVCVVAFTNCVNVFLSVLDCLRCNFFFAALIATPVGLSFLIPPSCCGFMGLPFNFAFLAAKSLVIRPGGIFIATPLAFFLFHVTTPATIADGRLWRIRRRSSTARSSGNGCTTGLSGNFAPSSNTRRSASESRVSITNLVLYRRGNWWRASSCLAADQQDRGKKSIRLPILLAPYLFCLRAAFL